ncbi:MAG TPA: non-ribosomal peptide synthase/polyketide synthase, partial [Thermoanaerobaculia bacterium]|nr:non-ribosomal peptide synthase/polyketide synthase [Thermoanaerobaculia bacterium]
PADHAVWERQRGEAFAAGLAFWRERLAGLPPLELPADRPRPATPSFRGGLSTLDLPPDTARALEALAQREKATPFMALLALFEALLLRYTGQSDFGIGTPVANRSRGELEGLIGPFVNTVVLRADLSGRPGFAELVRRAQEVTLAAFAHEEIPFEKLVVELRPEREPGANPWFQVLLTLQNQPWPELSVGGLDLEVSEVDTGTARADLTLIWRERDGGLAGTLEYSADLFEPASAGRLLGHLAELLRGALAGPERGIGELPLLSEAERRQILTEWRGGTPPYPREATVHELFAKQAAAAGDRVAVEDGDARLTYAELAARAHQLAHHLRSLGVGPDDRVGLAVEALAGRVAGMLGILEAGGAYVPLDLSYPRERLDWMAADAGLAALVHDGSWQGPAAAPAVDLGELPGLAAEVPALPPAGVTAGHLAYVLYTSGSTGRPKGVAVPHRAVVRLVAGTDYVHIEPSDRVAQISNASFDAMTFEVWGALLAGARLVGVPREEVLSPEALAERLAGQGITVAFLTTALFNQMARQAPGAFRGVRHLLFGGEAVDPGAVRQVLAQGPPERLVHVYGPTETTTFATWHLVATPPAPGATVPVGQPIANSTAYVADPDFNLAPPGVPGELLLGGDGLARGYPGRADLTAERFVPHPWSGQPGDRLYRTGDLVRRVGSGGAIEFLGRIDQQVKIRGFRIEPGEIEAVLATHPGVAACAVVVRGRSGEDRRLIAWLTPREGSAPGPAELRAWLAARLPAYMVPSAFGLLDALPLTPNGKVDRRALARREPPSAEARGAAPETPEEIRIAAVWSDLLGHERIGRDDDFFALGGHSLLATRVVSRLREELGVELPLLTVFENPTLAGLAAAVEQAAGAAPDDGPLPAEAGDEAPLSFAQERLWFLDQLRPGSATYNVPAAVRLSGALDTAKLAAAFSEIVRRHETLCTTFPEVDGEPRQRIAPPAPVPLPLIDLSASPGEARRLIAAEAAAPFDLAAGPLLRTTLLRLGDDEHLLLLTLHHIVADGWSVGLLVRELGALYAAGVLPELRVQYADFALWQRRRLSGAFLESELAFWRERLDGAPPELALPLDHARPLAPSGRAVSAPLRIRLARSSGATPFMVLLAAFQALLSRLADQTDLTVGTSVAGRQRAEIEGLIGFFVNTLVLRADLTGAPSFDEFLARVRRDALEAFAHQELPFEKLVELLQPGRNLGQTPLFQAFFALQNAPAGPLRLPGLAVEPLPEENAAAKFDLTLALSEEGDGFAGVLAGSADLFEEATVRRWAGCFERLLEAALRSPGERVLELPLLGEAERAQLLAWSAAAWAPPAPVRIEELFAQQVARTPDQVAAVCRGESLTYRELDERAGRLARLLRDGGLVGLMAMPDLPLLAGMLGILKAGCGFVPLDPGLPEERLERMVADCGLTVIAADRESLARCPAGAPVICLEDELPPLAPAAGTGDGTAYVIFTSGSTGVPKGVPITHDNLVPLLLWSRDVFGFGEHTRVLQSLSYAFDFGVFEILTTLLFGGTLYLRGGEERSDVEGYVREVREHAINTLHTTPSFFRAVAAEAGAAGLPTVEVLHLGGEALTEALVAEAFRVAPQCRVWNGYGPTEAAVNCALYDVGLAADWRPQGWASLPIGFPSAANRLYVLDRRLQPVPAGVPGELLVGGPALSQGYLGRPDLTAARFLPDPFGEPGGRLYRTGDLVRFHADGAIEFLGRVDHQVKVRGYRIELEEIEAALAAHPEVGACAVLVEGEARLVAYVAAPEGLELRRFLGRTLPPYMVPAAFTFLPELPLNASGKVDRKALALLTPSAAESRGGDPETPLERRIAAVWSDLLGRERIGRDDDFFALGGHSLLATRVVSRLRRELGVELPVLALFENPTLAGLAAVAAEAGIAPADGLVAGAGAPLSFAQERLWFLEQLHPGSAAYNVPAAVRLTGALDPAVLAACFGEIVRRHATLRSTFPAVDGEPVLQVAPATGVDLPVLDLTALPEEARRLTAAEAAAPFDLAAGPLLRTTLLRLGRDEHLLLLTLHHIVADGWSVGLLVRETAALYEAFAPGRPSPLPELPIQYPDFAAWQRRRLSGDALERELRFWSERLEGAPAELALPTDRPRPAQGSERGVSRPLRLEAGRVRALALASGATPFMVLLAAFEALLSRLTGQADLTVGTPVAGRERAEVENLIGLFVNTLVLRADLGEAPSFAGLLDRTREHALTAYAHQELPFEKLVEHLKPERDLGHTPLFQASFALQNAPAEPLRLPGLAVELLAGETAVAKFDLSLALGEDGDGFAGELIGSAGLFEAATVERWAGGFARLLEAALAAPGESVLELPLLGEAERAQLLAWSAAAWEPPAPVRIEELFAEQVARTPDKAAVVCRGRTLTYRQLAERAGRLAGRLASLGEGPVGLMAMPDLPLVAGLLGILRAGRGFVPLEPGLPADRLARMIADCGVSVVAADRENLARAAEIAAGAHKVCLDDEPGPPPPAALATGDGTAYVIFTSGSTGVPKGVPITHDNLVPLLLWSRDVFGFGERTRVLQSLSYAFDFGVFEILTTLLFGGTLFLRGDAEKSDLEGYVREVRAHGVNTLHTTPSFFRAAAAAAGAEGLPTVEVLHLGGEALTEALVAEAFRVAPQCRVWNGYGPTEAAVNCALYDVGRAADWRPRGTSSLPIGHPSAANRLYVADRRLHPVPAGVHGELLVGGIALSRGYLGRPDLTAARFVPDPFGREPGGRLYRTGDLVRFHADGAIEFLGRVDHQVKVRGYRIELEEIEAALAAHPEVGSCAVLAVRQEGGEPRLVAYVAAPEGLELRQFLGRTLPAYMVPAAFTFLPELPLNASGKVDRKALAALRSTGDAEARGGEPATPLERRIAAIWSDLLGRPWIGRNDDFFALGGHSLLATRVVARLRRELGVELPVPVLFEASTLADLAAVIEGIGGGLEEPIPAAGDAEEALSFSQERLWFLEQLHPGTARYNVPAAVRLAGALNPAALAAGFGEIVRRHATLRTTFPAVDGEPRQRIAPPAPVPLPLIDLSASPGEARRLIAAEAAAPFDLAAGPLLRTTLLRLGDDEHLLLLTLHHIVADGWSVGLLVREIGALYAAGVLPELPVQYADFALWQRRHLEGATLERELAFWSERLEGAPAGLALPTDRPRPTEPSGRGASCRLRLEAGLAGEIRALALRSGTTPFMVLLAAFAALLSRLSGQTDLTVGTPVAGRPRAEVENLIGFFVNTLVLRADLADAPSFEDLLARTRRHALAAYAHQELPFEKLVEHLAPERSLGHNPLFQVLFAVQNQPWPELRLDGLAISPVEVETGTAKADLSLVWRESEGVWEAALEYSTDLFEAATAGQLLRWTARLLAAAVSDLAAPVTELPLLDAAEQAALTRLARLAGAGAVETPERSAPRAKVTGERPRSTAPQTPVELTIASVWSDLLGQPRIGRDDSFFELGGHSLLATQVVSRLRDRLGVELPVRALFEEPTLRGLARRIEAQEPAAARPAAPPLARVERHGRLPLSFAQERLWFLEQLEPGSAFYNIPLASRLTGPLDVGALRQGIAELVDRHESLRTTFGDEQGRPFQVIAATAPALVPLVDLSGLPEPLRDREMRRQVAQESCRPFDLVRGPLFRLPLFRLGPEEHALVATMHHIISDGWSMTVLLREIAELYGALSAGRAPELPELPVQYADYAVWQRGYLQGAELEARLAYWRERLAGVPGLQLPLDRPRPPVETFRGRQRLVALSPELTHRLHELSTRQGVTLFMTLLAVFKVLLLRVTGQTDLPVGSPIANRYRSEVEGVIGFFANTIVLRTDLAGNPSFRELLSRVREVTLGAYAHEDLPFEKLVEEIQPERDMSRNPLFQVMCVLQNQPWPEAPMGEVRITSLPVDSGTAKFDLTLFWREDGGVLSGLLEHNSDLFDETTAWRLYRHHEALLQAALDDPEMRIGALPLLDEALRHQILAEWNGASEAAAGKVWAGRCVHLQVEEQAARTPDALAVIDGERTLSYAELDARANRLARGLARRGVRPEALVGICVERSLEMVVAALAVLKAGGALVALDPAYPRERLAAIIDDARLAVLLTQASLLAHFPEHQEIAFLLERGDDPFPEESAESPGVAVDPDHPIYAIYTSGSTGQPKGIVVTHRAFSNLLAWQLGDPGLRPGGRTVQFATFGFCVSFQEMLSSWSSGGTLVLADEMTRRDLPALSLFLEEHGIDRLHLPFAALKHLAEAATGQRLPARLQTVITAGEQLQVTPAVRSLFERLPGCTLSNQYGASETHVVTALTLSGDPAGWPAIPAVGRPVDNVSIHLLDARLAPVPLGVAGELYAGGACTPRCYLNDPVLTASKLVPDPFSGMPGARLYRTGDSARYLADGRIEYHGRIDTQVKIRGFRVELGEIETLLARHPGVRDAAVVARPGHDGPRLVAYVVPAGESDGLFDELRALVKQKLPEHMLPSAFVAMPVLPVNANGKLDQAALPEPEAEAPAEDYVAPRTPIEELIAGLWAEVLGLPRVGVRSDFFELGGHSLLATQVVARMRQALGVDLGVRSLFEARTVEGLTLAVAEALLDLADAPDVLAEPLARETRNEPPPLSFAQQRLWFLDQLTPGNPVYNLPATIELTGRLDVPALTATLTEVVRRHEVLRTTYSAPAGELAQVVAPAAPFALPQVDLRGLRPEEVRAETLRLADAEARRPFDLGDPRGGPMLRATLLSLEPGRHVLLVTMHHIASDGWSLGVLVREVGALYTAFAAGRPSPLPELPLQYADFAAWQRRHLSGGRLEAEIAWWRGRLAGMPPALDLPTDHPRQAALSGRGAAHVFRIGRETHAGLTALSKRQGATLFMTLLAGFAALLGRHAGQDDLAVGTPIAGRTRVETEPLIGLFVNTLVLRTDLSGSPGFTELLGRVREATLAAYAHQEIPFERLVEELAPARDLSRPPLVQVLFGLQNTPQGRLELPGLELAVASRDTGAARVELTCLLTETGQGLQGALEYSRDLFDAPAIERLAGHLARLLAGAAADPERRVAELPLLSAAERAELLAEWSGETTGYPREATIHALFAEQAALRPDAVAVTGPGETLTYGELQRRAGRLARRLRALGVGPEVRAGLCLDRSPARIVATLAVLQAGGAYVPLDPSHPRERLAALIEASGVAVLVTEERRAADLPPAAVPVLAIDREEPGEERADLPAVPASALAYVMYTSGSTGEPKGVAVPHRAVVRLVRETGYARFGPGEVFLHLAPYAFDASTLELWGALLNGGRVVVPPPGVPSPLELGELLREHGVTTLWLTAGLFHQMVEDNLPGLSGVRQLLAGGDVLSPAHVRRVVEELPGTLLINGYGPTENTTFTCCHPVAGLDGDGSPVPLGRPVANTWVAVLDRQLEPVPLGVAGELCAGGDGLARGYLGHPEWTAERFVPDPFGELRGEAGGRLYRTGDRVRYRPGGRLEFLGRLDAQVKIRGFR